MTAAHHTASRALQASPRRRSVRFLVRLLVAVALLCAVLVAAVAWALHSESGSRMLLAALPGVEVEASSGSLVGDFDADRLVIRLPGTGGTLALQDLSWRGLRVESAPSPLWLRVAADSAMLGRLNFSRADEAPKSQSTPPTDLQLPVELDLASLKIRELHADAIGAEPLRDIALRVHLGAGAGSEHRIDDLSLRRNRLHVQGRVRLQSAAPMTMAASAELSQQDEAARIPWSASVTIDGPLDTLALQARLKASAGRERPAQSLDARAALHPFARWPLGEVRASATALDLSALGDGLPQTALTAQVSVRSTASNEPLGIQVDLANDRSGRWDEGLLPLRSLKVDASTQASRPGEFEVRKLQAEVGTGKARAGRLTGQGGWNADAWTLALTLDGVRPALLDARAPSMELAGTIDLSGKRLSLDTVSAKAELAGRSTAGPVKIGLDADASPRRIEVRDLHALAGDTRGSLSGSMSRADDVRWQVRAQAALSDFDPAVWWPGPADSPLRHARSRLNATARVDALVPLSKQMSAREMLGPFQGDAVVTLDRSWLAGMSLTGEASLRGSDGGALARLAIDADGNSVHAEGRLAPAATHRDDAWDLRVDATALERLAPIAAWAGLRKDVVVAGSLNGSAHVEGRWPAVVTQGRLEGRALRIGTLSLQQAQAQWSAGTSQDSPLEAQVTLSKIARVRPDGASPLIDAAHLQVQGTARAHTLSLRAESATRLPLWLDSRPASAGSALDPVGPVVALLQAQGALVEPAGNSKSPLPSGWRGSVRSVEVRGGGATPVLRIADVPLQVAWSDGLHARVEPGRANLPFTSLHWSRIEWTGARPGAAAKLDVEAEMESLKVAPLLARSQPDIGWGGDLELAARLRLHSGKAGASGTTADLVVERKSGDLTITDESGAQSLGLTDLRLALVAGDGVWTLKQSANAGSLGSMATLVAMRTTAQAPWPDAQAALDGKVEVRVANLGAWGRWMRAGWRVEGALDAMATLSGRVGDPELTGRIDATRVAVRNFAQGVSVTEGDIAIRLEGSTAQIERFAAKGGKGVVKLTGDATLGAKPKLQLALMAERFQLLGRVDRSVMVSGNGRLELDLQSIVFGGRFAVDEGLIDITRGDAPELPEDVQVMRAKAAPAAGKPAVTAASPDNAVGRAVRNISLDLQFGLGENLRVRGRGLETALRGDLRITAPGGRPAINGQVRTVGGTYVAFGQKLDIDKGQVTFSGPIENPRLEIEATRPHLPVRVGVAITGNLAQPRVRVFSEPELSQNDKLSWLVLGRAPDNLSGNDSALLQAAAMTLMTSSRTGGQVTGALGLDQISVRQTGTDAQSTAVGLGKQLSENWYVGYERALNATTGTFQLVYRVAQRFTLRAQSGEDGTLELIWVWRWQ